jgi:hypothetical protein
MSEGSISGYRNPGDVKVHDIQLVTQFGQVIDITPIILETNIYQNMFEHYLQCELLIGDTLNLLQELPDFAADGDFKDLMGGFSGQEIVVLSYHDNPEEKPTNLRTHIFRLFAVSDRQKQEESKEGYLLSGISEEAYHTKTRKISKAYGGTSGSTVSNMVKSVFKEYFESGAVKDAYESLKSLLHGRVKKELIIDDTSNTQKFIIPNLTVDDTLDFFAREAEDPDHIPYYVFYEDGSNYHFRNICALTSQEPVATYINWTSNLDFPKAKDEERARKYDDAQKMIRYRVIRQLDLMGNINAGLYQSRTLHLDLLRKKTDTSIYDYDQYYSKFKKLNPKKISGGVPVGDAILTMTTTRTGHDTDVVFFEENVIPKRIDRIRDKRNGFKRSIFNTAVEVSLPGNPDLDVGKVVELVFPIRSDDYKQSQVMYDKYLTGKYLITKVRHVFQGVGKSQQFNTIIECTKDGGI